MAILLFYLVGSVIFIFWILQLIDLFLRDNRHFESHTHKLVWFLVIVVGNIIGAIWYYVWKKEAKAAFKARQLKI